MLGARFQQQARAN